MAKILELQKKDKYNKERTVGSIEIKNQTETTADLCFFGDINSESLGEWQKYYPEDKAPKDVQDFLDQLEGVSKINVHINSGGGSVFGGIAIYNILKRYDAEITVYVDKINDLVCKNQNCDTCELSARCNLKKYTPNKEEK